MLKKNIAHYVYIKILTKPYDKETLLYFQL